MGGCEGGREFPCTFQSVQKPERFSTFRFLPVKLSALWRQLEKARRHRPAGFSFFRYAFSSFLNSMYCFAVNHRSFSLSASQTPSRIICVVTIE